MKRDWMLGLAVVALVSWVGCGGGGGDDDGDGGTTVDGGTTTDGGTTVDSGGNPAPALIWLSAGQRSTCAVLANKTIKCWGDNLSGQLGNNSTVQQSVVPVQVMGITTAAQVSVGYEHACALLDDGTAMCWGNGDSGQLGNNAKADSKVPVAVMGLTGIKSIHAGMYISCALTTGGAVYCWGRGGDIGDGGVGESLVPKMVPLLPNGVMQFSLSNNAGRSSSIHACGVRSNGTAFCWGGNDVGQLGDNSQNSTRQPVDVMGVTDAIEITAGGGHACARRTSGLSCWGFGQNIGDGMTMQRLVPTPVMTTEATNLIVAGNQWTMARKTNGAAICWGYSGRGQCADGAAFTAGGPIYLMPVNTLLTDVKLMSMGAAHGCAHTNAGATVCWGSNEYGEAGSGMASSLFRTSTPAAVVW